MMFAVIYEVADDGSWPARAADLPVFSCADSREEVERETAPVSRLTWRKT